MCVQAHCDEKGVRSESTLASGYITEVSSRGLATLVTIGVAIGGSGCHLAMPGPVSDRLGVHGVETSTDSAGVLAGRIEVGRGGLAAYRRLNPASGRTAQNAGSDRKVQGVAEDRMAEIAKGATVSLIRLDSGQTVASAITNDLGQFELDFTATGFVPVTDQPYLLEAIKGLKMSDTGEPNAVGAAAARLRTLVVWNGGPTSFRNKVPGPLFISIGTTALSLLVRSTALDAAAQKALLGSLAANDVFTLPAGVTASVGTNYEAVWAMVRDSLSAGQDPVASVALPLASDSGSQANRTGPPLSIVRANPASLEPGSSITFYGRGFSKVANENVLWIRTFTVENDVAISASTVGPDGTWVKFDAPGGLPIPGPMSRYRVEVRQASTLGQTQYEVPQSVAKPAIRPGVLVPVAGDSLYGGSWREGTFDRTRFWGPSDVSLDAAGNLYICEHWYGNRVRVLARETGSFFGQVVQAGQVATVVGTGYGADLPRASRWNGDGPVLSTNLSLPWSAWVDPQGNVLITDYDAGPKFRVAARADGNLWGTTVKANWVNTMTFPTGAWGARGMTTDPAGNLYYYDWGETVVRFVPKTTATHWGQSMTANQSYVLTDPLGTGYNQLFVDPAGNLLVVGGNTVRILAKTAGTFYNQAVPALTLTTIAGSGASAFDGDGQDALVTGIWNYSGVAVDAGGNLFIADQNNRIRVLAAENGSVQIPVLGASAAIVPKGSTLKGKVYTALGIGTAGAASPGTANTAAAINIPYGLAMDSAGGLYIAEFGNNRVLFMGTR